MPPPRAGLPNDTSPAKNPNPATARARRARGREGREPEGGVEEAAAIIQLLLSELSAAWPAWVCGAITDGWTQQRFRKA